MDQIKDSQSRVAAAIDTMVILTRSQEGSLANIKANQLTVVSSLNSIKESQTKTVSTLDSMIEIARTQEGSLADINDNVSGTTSIIDRLADNSNMQLNALNDIVSNNSQISEINRNVGEVLDVVSSISSIEESINSEVMKFKDIIDAEVGQVEESMDKTNKLLERKFDEFTELLKKSNTEALVEVMKKVTEEFQKQMNSLISKLIQENFEQLNTSVERLNTWQQENKEMIASLTSQYKEMSENFEQTSTSLSKVKEDTTSLVGAGGKLHQIVDALNKVIVEDERFLDITKKLQDTANLSKENMEKFEDSTKALNEWVRKQRNFVDGVQSLIEKLDELNKIRDYGEQFWKSTKEKMEEGVNIISNGANTLNTQLNNLDRSFYERLGTTLSELDNCITKMVESLETRNHR
jgi:chromosome segregation ATPase